ncbi:MAG TPA: DNA-formamidopyrimidine glycosylase family protein [Egibacteraceae bacterium]|nr:DNA-formamidopyrimidine glycosylase family protein [Egibacteraceae bacterium]
MPELPEVQAHTERLAAAFRGAGLERFEPLSFTALKTFHPAPESAAGHALNDVGRRGKHLLLRFAPVTFVVHLMQGGRLRDDAGRSKRPRGGVARWRFSDGRALLLTEAGTERKAGVWVVEGDPLAQAPLAGLGPEADGLSAEALAELLADRSMRLHTFLRDQSALAGLGRRLANEVCHRARLSPFAPTAKLADDEVARVAEAIRAAIDEGLVFERARDDMSSSRERPAAVHGRVGESCPVCGSVIRAVEYRDYTVAYCPACQTGGKILADNTTSKFLK